MVQGGTVSTINQHHTGTGDNVQHKLDIVIQALAPSHLRKAIDLLLADVRKKNIVSAKVRLETMKATEHGNSEVSALLDVIALYGDLVEPEGTQEALNAVTRVTATTQDAIVKDHCIAALLKFSRKTDSEESAKELYDETTNPGPYAREAFYRYYATVDVLLAASKKLILSEGELTGIVDGACRLEALDIASPAAVRLHDLYPSDNSRVLLLITKALRLNPAVKERSYWLTDPQLKHSIDELVAEVAELIEQSNGSDARLYDMAGPILDYFQTSLPIRLLNVCAKYVDHMEASYPEVAARIRSTQGDHSGLSESMQSVTAAQGAQDARIAWCQAFLASDAVQLLDAVFFTRFAKPDELRRWLTTEAIIADAGDIDTAMVMLLAHSQLVVHTNDLVERYELEGKVDEFIGLFGQRIQSELSAWIVLEVAENLYEAEIPQKALTLTSAVLPDGELWPSPFVLLHLRCLLETQQYQSFDTLIARIPGGERSLSLMHFLSLKEEALGDVERALELSDQMIQIAPHNLSCWLRGCELRERYHNLDEQRQFHDGIPDEILEDYSHESMVVMRFLTSAGNFKRAEPRLVRWFLEDPSGRAVMLVNFHFGSAWRRQAGFNVSSVVSGCLEGIEFEQDGKPQIRLIVEEGEAKGQHVLIRDSQLGNLLVSLEVNQAALLGVVEYKLLSRVPPYVACIRLASQLRHLQNDGSDVFAILQLPKDPADFVTYLEQKLRVNRSPRKESLNDDIPLFIRSHAEQGDNPIKAALNAWSDSTIPKSLLVNEGSAEPGEIVLDAYSIAYLTMTNIVDKLLNKGYTFVLPGETKVILQRWVEHVSHESFLMMGVNGAGRLFRTTASDVQARDGHTLRGMRRILEEAVVKHPVVHDTALELYSIKDGIDATVYLAIQLSAANEIPWFCMDFAFAGLHYSKGWKVANVNTILLSVTDTPDFDFEERRHGLLLFALNTLPRPLMLTELKGLAGNPNPLSSMILSKIFENHGRQIFSDDARLWLLLELLISHIVCTFYRLAMPATRAPAYTPLGQYEEHVFNHGLRLFVYERGDQSAEFWLAVALRASLDILGVDQKLSNYAAGLFADFVGGHFMDVDAIVQHYGALPDEYQLPLGR